MKFAVRAGSILTAVALSIIGCDPAEPKSEGPPEPEEHSTSKQGPPSPAAPVVPAPNVSLPSTSKAERDAEAKKEESKASEKKEEPKAAEKKEEPKVEPPK